METPFDVIVIGGGPGGYVAALRARQLGLSTALIEAQDLGGVCLNWGCIPTKALLKSSSLFQVAHHMQHFGVSAEVIRAHIQDMVKRSRHITSQLAMGIKTLLNKAGVTTYKAWGSLQGKRNTQGYHRVSLTFTEDQTSSSLLGQHIILATGARARMPFDAEFGLWSAREAMTPHHLPKDLLIIGAGAIGIEFASFYQTLGTQVTVVERAARILPMEDEEIVAIAQKCFLEQGIKILQEHSVVDITRQKTQKSSKFSVTLEERSGQRTLWKGEEVLCAMGVIGNTDNIGLEHTAIQIEGGYIVTHTFGQTHEEGVYAIGDVAGAPCLAHKASHEGALCAEFIAGRTSAHPLEKNNIPGCVYSTPQIASLGLSEAKAREQNIPLKIGRFPFSANGQALAQGDSTGLVKILFHQITGELLGAHIIGAQASELITTLTVAKSLEATEEALRHIVFPHPTLSEMIHEAVMDADDEALHIPLKTPLKK